MKERPIIMTRESVTAILDKSKTHSRRVILRPERFTRIRECAFCCPYGVPGDRLWVKHEYYLHNNKHQAWDDLPGGYERFSDGERYDTQSAPCFQWLREEWKKMSPLHMYRWASRINLEICEIRVERVQEITEADAKAEGVTDSWMKIGDPQSLYWQGGSTMIDERCPVFDPLRAIQGYRAGFGMRWDKINAQRPGCAWKDNPWVWAVVFRLVEEKEGIHVPSL